MTKPTEQLIDEGWEKRFDKNGWQKMMRAGTETPFNDEVMVDYDSVKDFIRKEIAERDALIELLRAGNEADKENAVAEAIEQTRKEDIAAVEKLKKECEKDGLEKHAECCDGVIEILAFLHKQD